MVKQKASQIIERNPLIRKIMQKQFSSSNAYSERLGSDETTRRLLAKLIAYKTIPPNNHSVNLIRFSQ